MKATLSHYRTKCEKDFAMNRYEAYFFKDKMVLLRNNEYLGEYSLNNKRGWRNTPDGMAKLLWNVYVVT